jgi:hypothetical protein
MIGERARAVTQPIPGWRFNYDSVMTTHFFLTTGQPFMLMPLTYSALMLAGLLKSRRAVFGH